MPAGNIVLHSKNLGFPGGVVVKTCNAGDTINAGLIPGKAYLAIQMRNSMRHVYLVTRPQFLTHSSPSPCSSLSDEGNEIIRGLLSSVPENTSGNPMQG